MSRQRIILRPPSKRNPLSAILDVSVIEDRMIEIARRARGTPRIAKARRMVEEART
ncbi:MAG TPA: hypothetical protein VGR25_03650 [bacterium]|jgi:Holliday junction resolvasome RuvABC ATP-dependent DNA helicase subunit|nr:hypothetical protein [bacterium]